MQGSQQTALAFSNFAQLTKSSLKVNAKKNAGGLLLSKYPQLDSSIPLKTLNFLFQSALLQRDVTDTGVKVCTSGFRGRYGYSMAPDSRVCMAEWQAYLSRGEETCYVDHRSEFLGKELWLVHTFQASVSSCRWAMQASCSNAQIVRFAIVY